MNSKKISSAVLLGLILAFFGCNDENMAPIQDDDNDELPPVEFSFEYDGNTFEADTAFWRRNSANQMSFFASDPSGSSLYLEFEEFYGLGDYLFMTQQFSGGSAKFIRVDNGDTAVYRIADQLPIVIDGGEVDIDSLTTNPETYSGEFELLLVEFGGTADSISLESGVFQYLRECSFDLDPEPGQISYWFDGMHHSTSDYKAFILGSNLVHLEVFDDGLYNGKVRVLWPLKYTQDELLYHSSVTMSGIGIQFPLYHPCAILNSIEDVEFSQDLTKISASLRTDSYDFELKLNNIELDRPFIPLEQGEGVLSPIYNGEQYFFDEIECVYVDQYVYHLEARNDNNNLLVIETSGIPSADFSHLGYSNHCFHQYNAYFTLFETEGENAVNVSQGWMIVDNSPRDDPFANIGFSSEYFGFPGDASQVIFAADSIEIQY